jgi:hypothetical protein
MPVVDPADGTFGFHPTMLPVIEAKMKRAGPLAEPLVITKFDVPFATTPVGKLPGIVTVSAFFMNGVPEASPP